MFCTIFSPHQFRLVARPTKFFSPYNYVSKQRHKMHQVLPLLLLRQIYKNVLHKDYKRPTDTIKPFVFLFPFFLIFMAAQPCNNRCCCCREAKTTHKLVLSSRLYRNGESGRGMIALFGAVVVVVPVLFLCCNIAAGSFTVREPVPLPSSSYYCQPLHLPT